MGLWSIRTTSSRSSSSSKGWEGMRSTTMISLPSRILGGRRIQYDYGCPLLPRDIHLDKEAHAALNTVRKLYHKYGNRASSSVTTAPADTVTGLGAVGEEDSNDNGSSNNDRAVAVEEEKEQFTESRKLNKALELLKTVGGQDQATLTLRGNKGGKIEDQVNQDRAFVLSPFYFNDGNDYDNNIDLELLESSDGSLSSSSSLSTTIDNSAGIGRQRQPTNRLLGVFDGHAKRGELVSEYTAINLPRILASKLENIHSSNNIVEVSPSPLSSSDTPTTTTTTTTTDINNSNNHHLPTAASTSTSTATTTQKTHQALIETFLHLDKTVPAHPSGGCTASIFLQLGSKLYIANTGDSRSILATYTKSTSTVDIVYISREDKPDLPGERARVEAMGGKVVRNRVVVHTAGSSKGFSLAMSRSIGNWEAGKVGVIPDPTVVVMDLLDLSDGNGDVEVFAICATDGLLDFVDINTVVKTIADSLYVEEGRSSTHLLSACESIITTAGMLWSKAMNGRYRDDISIAVSKISF